MTKLNERGVGARHWRMSHSDAHQSVSLSAYTRRFFALSSCQHSPSYSVFQERTERKL